MRLKTGKSMGVAYYTGKYKTYVVEAPKAIPESPHFFPKGTDVSVWIMFFIAKPKKPANPYPVGDIDNFCKSILDAITKNGTYWHDDAQVSFLFCSKKYTEGEARTEVIIKERR